MGTLAALRAACELPVERLHAISADLQAEMRKGLAADGCQLKMLPSHVARLPSGWVASRRRSYPGPHAARAARRRRIERALRADARKPRALIRPVRVRACARSPRRSERGVWYALDLGGTNFRVLRLTLSEAQSTIADVQARAQRSAHSAQALPLTRSASHAQTEEVAIPAALLRGTCAQLFDFIAARVVGFTGSEADGALGFTFSFACAQTALDAGTLLEWTKGFALQDGIGLDVVALLRAALTAAGSRLRVAALVNDTVGTLAAARYADASACVAVILGTGVRWTALTL
jgi:hexokinase